MEREGDQWNGRARLPPSRTRERLGGSLALPSPFSMSGALNNGTNLL